MLMDRPKTPGGILADHGYDVDLGLQKKKATY